MDKQTLLEKKENLIRHYRGMVVWACRVLEYKRRFDSTEDFGTDGLQDYMNILKDDSRRELKDIAVNVRLVRKQISDINNELMNMTGEKDGR